MQCGQGRQPGGCCVQSRPVLAFSWEHLGTASTCSAARAARRGVSACSRNPFRPVHESTLGRESTCCAPARREVTACSRPVPACSWELLGSGRLGRAYTVLPVQLAVAACTAVQLTHSCLFMGAPWVGRARVVLPWQPVRAGGRCIQSTRSFLHLVSGEHCIQVWSWVQSMQAAGSCTCSALNLQGLGCSLTCRLVPYNQLHIQLSST
jgi:hypothetical protein